MKTPTEKVTEAMFLIGDVQYVRANLAMALAMEVEELQKAARATSWDLDRLRQYDSDNFVADGQWT